MIQYRIFDALIDSNVDLGLSNTTGHVPGITFELSSDRWSEFASRQPFQCFWLPDGALWLSLLKGESGYRLHFPNLADFEVSASGSQIRCYPYKGMPLNTIVHLFLDHVLPTVLSHRGNTILHASGVVISEKAVIFLGETQSGKSTLVASLNSEGLPLLADDCLLINGDLPITALGGYHSIRLWPDSLAALAPDTVHHEAVAHYTEKRRLRSNHQFCDVPVPVHNLYLIAAPHNAGPNPPITIESMSFREQVTTLLEHSFRLDPTDRERNAREFETLTRLAEKLPMYRLSYPRRYDMLPAVREAILAHVQETGGHG